MSNPNKRAVEELVISRYPGISAEQAKKVGEFYEKLVAENEIQNLTRLISPVEFVEGHLEDVIALRESGLVEFPAMDLGSGGGVPGLLWAVIWGGHWVISDSERRKAEFLERTASEMALKNIRVFAGRGEDFFKNGKVNSVVARAVGPVDRVYAWIGKCSTWNNLVLLKGPSWAKEWDDFSAGRNKGKLLVDKEFNYTVGAEKKTRRIVRLSRVRK